MAELDQEFAGRLKSAMEAFVTGDPRPFAALWSPADDVVLMGGFGGHATGHEAVRARLRWAARQYARGRIEVERVATYAGPDLVCEVAVEHSTGIGGDPERAMDLRVTQVFRLEEGDWRIVHRQADPIRPQAEP